MASAASPAPAVTITQEGPLNAKKQLPAQLGAATFEVKLGTPSSPLLFNSVLLAPSLLSDDECRTLIAHVDSRADAVFSSSSSSSSPSSSGLAASGRQQARKRQATVRIRVCDLAAEAQAIDQTLRSRLLTLLEEEHPTIAMALFGHTSGLAALTPEFSACEPAVNIYTEGGVFEEHEDGYALSVNVLLSDGTAFTGGGTRFQNENHAGLNAGGLGRDTESEHHKIRRLEAMGPAAAAAAAAVERTRVQGKVVGESGGSSNSSTAGGVGGGGSGGGDVGSSSSNSIGGGNGNGESALLHRGTTATTVFPEVAGMGILFSGNVRHSGCKVTSGVRHLYVASFDLTEP